MMSILIGLAAVVGGVALWVFLATSGELLGKEVGAWLPVFARRLVRGAARWQPEAERQDFQDENLDIVEGYVGDGRILTGLSVALFEWRRGAWSVGLPGWVLSDGANRPERLVLGVGFGLGYGLVVVPLAGPATGSLVSLVGLVSGLIYGLVGGSPFRLVNGVVFGLVFGLAVGFAVGAVYGSPAGLSYGFVSSLAGLFSGLLCGLANRTRFAPILGGAMGWRWGSLACSSSES